MHTEPLYIKERCFQISPPMLLAFLISGFCIYQPCKCRAYLSCGFTIANTIVTDGGGNCNGGLWPSDTGKNTNPLLYVFPAFLKVLEPVVTPSLPDAEHFGAAGWACSLIRCPAHFSFITQFNFCAILGQPSLSLNTCAASLL